MAEKRLAYCAQLLIQLVNGARVSEAVDCFFRWLESGNRNLNIRTRKVPNFKKKQVREENVKLSDGSEKKIKIWNKVPKTKAQLEKDMRLMSVPPEITEEDRERFLKIQNRLKAGNPVEALRSFTRRTLSLRTHAFRYAWQSDQIDRGESPLDIAKKQGRKTLQSLMDYTQTKRNRKKLIEEIQGTTLNG